MSLKISTEEAQFIPKEFELLEILGSGASGRVYKANSKMLQSLVAIKILNAEPGQKAKIRREARALAKLNHQNIVKLLQLAPSPVDGSLCLVYEYLDGVTLQDYLEGKTLKLWEIKSIFEQILSGLEHMHAEGIIHRDLSPCNIMLIKHFEKWQVKILDFGIARLFENQSATMTCSDIARGTPAFMSPEQCMGKALGPQSDLYSVACMLYLCLANKPLFAAESAMDVMYKQIHEPPQIESVYPSNKALQLLLASALAKNESARPESASKFKAELESAMASYTSDLEESSSNRSAAAVGSSITRNRSLLFPFLALGLLASVGLLLFVFTKNSVESNPDQVLSSTRKKSNVKAMSPLARLIDAFRNVHIEVPKKAYKDNAPLYRSRIAEIYALIPQLPDNTHKYVAYTLLAYLRKDVEPHSKEELSDLQSALKCCQTKKGEAIQASQCHLWIAENLWSAHPDKEKIEYHLKKGLELSSVIDRTTSLASLEIPAEFHTAQLRAVRFELARLASNYYHWLSDNEKTVEYAKETIRIGSIMHPTFWFHSEVLRVAEIYIKEGRSKEGYELLSELDHDLKHSEFQDSHDAVGTVGAYIALINFLKTHKQISQAEIALEHAREIMEANPHTKEDPESRPLLKLKV